MSGMKKSVLLFTCSILGLQVCVSQSSVYMCLYFLVLHFTVFILLCLYFPYLQSKCVRVLPHLYSTTHILYFQFFNLCTCIVQSQACKSAFPSLQSICVCISQSWLEVSVFSHLCSTMRVLPALLSMCMYVYKSLFPNLQSICVCVCLDFPDLPVCLCISSLHSFMHIFPILRSMCLYFAIFSLSEFSSLVCMFLDFPFLILLLLILCVCISKILSLHVCVSQQQSTCLCFPITIYMFVSQ